MLGSRKGHLPQPPRQTVEYGVEVLQTSAPGQKICVSYDGRILIFAGLQSRHWQLPGPPGSGTLVENQINEYRPASPGHRTFISIARIGKESHGNDASCLQNGYYSERGSFGLEDKPDEIAETNTTEAIANVGSEMGEWGYTATLQAPINPKPELQLSVNEVAAFGDVIDLQPGVQTEKENTFEENQPSYRASPSLPAEEESGSSEDIDKTATEVLVADDLPSPFLPISKKLLSYGPEDAAAKIIREQYAPLPAASSFLGAMTRLPPSQRSTETLYTLAENAQRALVAWQDEYIRLDAKTAPASHPPKRPATGGRLPTDPATFDAILQSELYGYPLDPRKEPAAQDPFVQRMPRRASAYVLASNQHARSEHLDADSWDEMSSFNRRTPDTSRRGGSSEMRELRSRLRKRGLDYDENDDSEDGEQSGHRRGSRGPHKRRRRGGLRNNYGTDSERTSATPDPVRKPSVFRSGKRRGRPPLSSLARAPVSRAAPNEDMGETPEGFGAAQTPTQAPKRRGRPPGSKNAAKRSDAGIKKGPRMKISSVAKDGTCREIDFINEYSPSADAALSGPMSTEDQMAVNSEFTASRDDGARDDGTRDDRRSTYAGQSMDDVTASSQARPTRSFGGVENSTPSSRQNMPRMGEFHNPNYRMSSSSLSPTGFKNPMGGSTSPKNSYGPMNSKEKKIVKSKRSESMKKAWQTRKARAAVLATSTAAVAARARAPAPAPATAPAPAYAPTPALAPAPAPAPASAPTSLPPSESRIMEPVSEIIQAKVEPEKERIATHDPALLELNEEQKEFRQLEDRLGEFLQAYSQNPISAKPNSSSFNDQMAYPLDYQQNTRPAAIPDRPGLEAQYGYREVHDGGYVYQPEQQTRDAEDPSAQAGNTSAERLMI